MSSMGLRPDRPHRKCAGVVGDTWASTTPTATAPSTTLTRMGQTFSRNVCLVDPDFGTLDDPPPPTATPVPLVKYCDGAVGGDLRRPSSSSTPRSTARARRADLTCFGAPTEPAGQRHDRHRRRHGHQHRRTTSSRVYEAIKLVMTKRRPKPTVEELRAVLPGPDLRRGA